jgi:TatD DNase family protein
VRLIDSHAHLDDRAFGKDRAVVIARAFAEEIGVITIGADLRSSREAVHLAERHRRIWATVGAHPHGAKHVDASTLEALERLARRDVVVAIGEIGLDYYRDLSPRDVQRRAFREQLNLAHRLDLPICLHDRESTDDLLAILRDTGAEHRGVVHSFLGDAEVAQEFLELGLHLGIGGPVTFPKNGALREAVKDVPVERLLIETDCPYLPPVPYRGRRNEPSYVAYVAEEIARVKGINVEDGARRTTENAVRLFDLPA